MAYGEKAMEHPEPTGNDESACHGDVCVTCSDEAVPVRIARLLPGGLALAEVAPAASAWPGAPGPADRREPVTGARPPGPTLEQISVALVDAAVGATVLVHAGEAIAVIDDGGEGGGTDVSRNTR
jgi:hypothetical protein